VLPANGAGFDPVVRGPDANWNQTTFTNDAFGRVTQTNFPLSSAEAQLSLRRFTESVLCRFQRAPDLRPAYIKMSHSADGLRSHRAHSDAARKK